MLKLVQPRRVEWLSFFSMMPVLSFVLNYIMFGDRLWSEMDIWYYSFTVIYIQGFLSWYLHIVVMHWLRIRFPLIKQTSKRLVILGLSHMLLTSGTFLFLFYAYDYFNFLGYEFQSEGFQSALLLSVALTLIATSLWEADYTFKQWKDSIAEKERLEQLTLNHEFETLKSQVNPHFLFNCFNTLSSLISEDRKQAEGFLNELSKVYRYLLRNNEDGLSTVQTELKFIESYYNLLKTRHGDAVELKIEVDKKYEHYLLPSLSLQLLVENAVKHNVLSKNKPLVIDIFTTAGKKLVITNNIQLRSVKAPSNKIGLENIKAKYELLRNEMPQVLKDAKTFTVVLPLIWNKKTESQLIIKEKENLIKTEV